MKYIIPYILIAALAYFIIHHVIKKQQAISYLNGELNIPSTIINKMSYKELIAAAEYLQEYAKTKRHFTVDDKNYNLLSSIRIKYGIFS